MDVDGPCIPDWAILLAYLLLRTSRLMQQGDVIMMQRSNAFFTIFLAVAADRPRAVDSKYCE